MLQSEQNRGKLIIKNGWAMCPVCGKGKLLKLLPESTVHALPCKCKLCGQTTNVNIDAPEPASCETSA